MSSPRITRHRRRTRAALAALAAAVVAAGLAVVPGAAATGAPAEPSDAVERDGPAEDAESADDLVPAGYELAWSDEFDGVQADGTGLDTDEWYYREGTKAVCSNEPENVSVSDGLLHISLEKNDDPEAAPYTCGGVISQRWFGYGYYETSAQLWGDAGFHSAFWTTGLADAMPDTPEYLGPNNRVNEIDGFEIDSHAPERIQHHSHWFDPNHVGNQGGVYTGPDSSDGYHTYGFEWLPNEIRFFVDGVLARVQPYAGPHGQQSVWLTTLGYTEPVDETNLPGETTWDYFRYYAPTDAPDGATPGSVVVDNGEPGYAETGAWEDADTVTDGHQQAFGFQDRATRRAVAIDAVASWTPELASAASYEVFAWNPSFLATGHTAATYTVTHDGGSTDVVVNQATEGQEWVSLGSYAMTPGTGQGVRVTGDPTGTGTLRADAAMFTPAVVVDNADPGYAETGAWSSSAAVAGWRGSETRFASASSSRATWTPELPEDGTYAVYAWTPTHELNTAVARFTVRHAGGETVVEAPHVDGWTELGAFTFDEGTAGSIELSKPTGTVGYLRADAVKLVPVPEPDDVAPAAPLRVRGLVDTSHASGNIELTWTWQASAEEDVVGYHVYLDGQRVTWNPVQRTTFTMDEMRAGQRVELTVTAVDASGNESAPSRPARKPIPGDHRAPAAPQGLVGEAANGRAILYWTQSTEVDLLGYRVYADGELVTPDGPVGHPNDYGYPSLGYPVEGLSNGAEHTLEITAVDLSGNESAPAAVTVTPREMAIIGVTDPGYSEQGVWTSSSVAGWLRTPTRTSSLTTATATWRPELTEAGRYEVYAWVPNHVNSTSAARYTINHAGGTDAVEIDQRSGGSRWVLLGEFAFDAGATSDVAVSNAALAGYLRTSAVKFVPVE